MFPETKSGETLRFEGNTIYCSPRDQSLSDLLNSKTKRELAIEWARCSGKNASYITRLFSSNNIYFCKYGAVVRALASHRCCPGSISGPGVI